MLLQNYFETRMKLIDNALAAALDFDKAQADSLKEAIRKAVFPGGKRWRPLLLISMFEMLTGMKKNHKLLPDAINAAIAVEFVHNAALIHDDLPMLMNRKERRGAQSIHQEYGNVIAILAGDALYTLGFEAMGNIRDAAKASQMIRILAMNTKSYGLIGGQAIDLANKRKVMKINTLRYIDIKKVGSLLQTCADLACILADSDEATRQVLGTYATNLGMAYQMIDDIEADYARGSEGLDFSEEYVPTSKSGYTGLLGFDRARREVENLLDECTRSIKNYDNNDVLMEFIQMISERLP